MLSTAYRVLIAALSGVFSLGLAALAAVWVALWYFGRDLPDYQALAAYEPPIVSRVYAGDGRLIGEFASERRIFVPYGAIPERVRHAVIAAEDRRFMSHPGIDVYAIARALHEHYIEGGRLRGGSTITQQVAKNFFLSSRRSLERKAREVILALRMERAYTKEKILELYLNQIFFGRHAYGIAAAAQAYFDKSLDELTLAETAFLAALPQAPSRFNPERQGRLAVERRNYVLHRMYEDGYIERAALEEALAAPLGIKPRPPTNNGGADYFVEEVRRELLAKHGEEKMKSGGFVVRSTVDLSLQAMADAALRRGLVNYDRRHGWRGPLANLKAAGDANWADNWRRKLVRQRPPGLPPDWQVALVLVVNPRGADIGLAEGGHGHIPLAELTWARKLGDMPVKPGKPAFKTAKGPPVRRPADVLKEGDVILVERLHPGARNAAARDDVFALRQIPEVTGALVAMDPHTGRVLAMSGGFSFAMRQYNNATQAWRQPGSSFKPYVYLAALAAGFRPNTSILDAPIEQKVGNRVYRPRNYEDRFFGPVTMRQALQYSLNSATLRLAEATGRERVAELATRLGVSEKLEPIFSMALGAFETTPLRQATAYSMIANGGKQITATLVDRIQDRYGRTIYRHHTRNCAACAQMAYSGQSMPERADGREQAIDEDNAYQMTTMLQDSLQKSPPVAPLGRRLAGKTGTTNEGMDAWFVGFSSDLTVAVWVGFDAPRTLGRTETGSLSAGPIFADFMRAASELRPPRDFQRPPGIVVAGSGRTAEFYKRGNEPFTGKGRDFVGYTPKKPELDPDAPEPGSGYVLQMPDDEDDPTRPGYSYQPGSPDARPPSLQMPPQERRPAPGYSYQTPDEPPRDQRRYNYQPEQPMQDRRRATDPRDQRRYADPREQPRYIDQPDLPRPGARRVPREYRAWPEDGPMDRDY